MKILEKVEMISKLKEKILDAQDSNKKEAKKLKRLLKLVCSTDDVNYI